MKVFNEAVAAGDDVLGIFISSDLSGTYQSACLAALDVEEETGKKLYMVDSRTSLQQLLVHLNILKWVADFQELLHLQEQCFI